MEMIRRAYTTNTHISGTVIELAASGFAAYQILSKKIPGIIGYKPERSKTARASGIVPVVNAGNVLLPESCEWLDAFVNEFALFPASKNDDMVDSVSMGINYMMSQSPMITAEAVWGRGAFALPPMKMDW